MDTSWLADLIEIEKHGSFSKAAVARNISVSALSRRIQQRYELCLWNLLES